MSVRERAAGGRTVRWGVLYRSGQLSNLTRRGLAQFGALGLTTLIDLRSDEEREQAPDRLPAGAPICVVEIPILDVMREFGHELTHRLSTGDVAGVDVPALMARTYRQFAVAFTPQFGQVMREVLAAEGRPVLFHCTAGKDRTGFAAALLLRLLRVPQETVLRDYAMSTRYVLETWRRDILLLRLTRGRPAAEVVRQLCSA